MKAMKAFAIVLAVGLGLAAGALIMSQRLVTRHAAQLERERAAWQADKAALEAALEEARNRTRVLTVPAASPRVAVPPAAAKLSPVDILGKLAELRSAPANQTRALRHAVYWMEELIAAGPAALPAIRDFLRRNEEIDFSATSASRGSRGVGAEFILPPSLRFGLFDVVKQIGGAEAEEALAEVLGATGRGVEVAWLARALQDMAPNKYRDAALNAARELLARPLVANPSSALDRNERDLLYGVLTMYGDTSYVSTAQEQMVRSNGEVDRSALKYLQSSLGQQAVGLAAQWYDDPRITDPANKEPFARLALSYVGADAQANEFYQKAINDFTLTKSHRKNLIEDLNQDGFADTRNLTAGDLPVIENRIALIEQLAPSAADPVNAAAFKEAYKDLVNMRERVTRPPQPPP